MSKWAIGLAWGTIALVLYHLGALWAAFVVVAVAIVMRKWVKWWNGHEDAIFLECPKHPGYYFSYYEFSGEEHSRCKACERDELLGNQFRPLGSNWKQARDGNGSPPDGGDRGLGPN